MNKTAIEWATESWNPVLGTVGPWACERVSPGCAYCYASALNQRRGGPAFLPGHDRPRLSYERLEEPGKRRRPGLIFVCSMTDLFWESVPELWIYTILNVCLAADQHTYLLLTKRPGRMRVVVAGWLEARGLSALPGHIWAGVSAENQRMLDERLTELQQIPAVVRWVSAEPLLGPLDLAAWIDPSPARNRGPAFHWLVLGGESAGPASRRLVERCDGWCPFLNIHGGRSISRLRRADRRDCGDCHGTGWRPRGTDWPNPATASRRAPIGWVRSVRDQCTAAGMAFFFKQWGGPTPKAAGRLLDGRTWEQYPIPVAGLCLERLPLPGFGRERLGPAHS